MRKNFKANKKLLAKERHVCADGVERNIISTSGLTDNQMYTSNAIEPMGYISERQCRTWRRDDGLKKGEFYT